ncbi:glycine cleavage system H protein [Pseudozyma hubeiensis SY62]|uniref:Glycine cleavage system H protein n=1 Tax=Pseudozyma hubeiensis (strain SY62) TaxID=1305764 RepID=R9PDC4_PSEHS|nr:glycine cleavage system H protein [Pseudozyma hubeiensis SY62]GAC96110.1 glycine cleavage system H protein [Pseudozyma hubeiensis SY62]
MEALCFVEAVDFAGATVGNTVFCCGSEDVFEAERDTFARTGVEAEALDEGTAADFFFVHFSAFEVERAVDENEDVELDVEAADVGEKEGGAVVAPLFPKYNTYVAAIGRGIGAVKTSPCIGTIFNGVMRGITAAFTAASAKMSKAVARYMQSKAALRFVDRVILISVLCLCEGKK